MHFTSPFGQGLRAATWQAVTDGGSRPLALRGFGATSQGTAPRVYGVCTQPNWSGAVLVPPRSGKASAAKLLSPEQIEPTQAMLARHTGRAPQPAS